MAEEYEDEFEGDPVLGTRLADVVTYADLLATYYGIDLGSAVVAKFNAVSELQGFPERLSA